MYFYNIVCGFVHWSAGALSEAAQFMSNVTAKRADFQTILPALIKIFVQCRRYFSPEVMTDNTVFKLV